MTNSTKTEYDRLEAKLVDIAQKMLDNFGICKDDLIDIINDQVEGDSIIESDGKIRIVGSQK